MATSSAREKPHRLRALGHFDTSYHLLGKAGLEEYLKKDGSHLAPETVEPGAGGIVFGVMEKTPKTFLIVRVGDLVLRAPVLLTGDRHGAWAPGPKAAHLDDDSAVRVIVDAIVANPEYRDHLGDEIRKIGRREGSMAAGP